MEKLNYNDMSLYNEDTMQGYEDMPDFEEVEIPDFPIEETIPEPDFGDIPQELPTESHEAPEVKETTTETEEAKESEPQAPKQEAPKKLSEYESVILSEMNKRAQTDTLLAKGLTDKDKSIQDCYNYVRERARKKAVSGCAMIEDNEVYGWAVHYYIEPKEVIDKEMGPKIAPKKSVSEKAVKKIKSNPLLASLMEKKGYRPTEKGEVTKTSILRSGDTKEIKVSDKTKVTTIKGKGGQLTLTEFSLF